MSTEQQESLTPPEPPGTIEPEIDLAARVAEVFGDDPLKWPDDPIAALEEHDAKEAGSTPPVTPPTTPPSETPVDPVDEDEAALEKILSQYGNDPKALARALRDKESFIGRQSNEIGALRQRATEVVPDPEPASPPPTVGPRGFELDEYGIERVPVSYWYSEDYQSRLEKWLVGQGVTEDRLVQAMAAETQQSIAEELRRYDEERSRVVFSREREEQEFIASREDAMNKEFLDARARWEGELSKVVPPEVVEKVIDQCGRYMTETVRSAVERGELTRTQVVSEGFPSALFDHVMKDVFGVDKWLQATPAAPAMAGGRPAPVTSPAAPSAPATPPAPAALPDKTKVYRINGEVMDYEDIENFARTLGVNVSEILEHADKT